MEKTRDMSRWIVHLDMDAYFAAVEMRDDMSLRNVPMAVGGDMMLVSWQCDACFLIKVTCSRRRIIPHDALAYALQCPDILRNSYVLSCALFVEALQSLHWR